MRLHHIAVQNYKSLRGLSIHPKPLSVIVGANASGKSNFADGIDFLSEAYRHGLEIAIARKGGYENMAFRRMRRSKGAISFEATADLGDADVRGWYRRVKPSPLRIRHRFSFGTQSQAISAEFAVESEEITIFHKFEGRWLTYASIQRRSSGHVTLRENASEQPNADTEELRHLLDFDDLRFLSERRKRISPTELLISSTGRFTPGLYAFATALSDVRVFQISPTRSREFGVPLPRAELGGTGANLPAVVDRLKKNEPRQWRAVLRAMRAVLPQLTDIQVDYTSSRTLGLLFHEEGIGRPWNVGEVSDGTIQTLALLVAVFDSRATALVIEEPENSIHPWIIRRLLEACREASATKQIMITTHSPIVMNGVDPSCVYVIWRRRGESHLQALEELDDKFRAAWESGQIATFDFIDSGALEEAIPPGPQLTLPLSGDSEEEE